LIANASWTAQSIKKPGRLKKAFQDAMTFGEKRLRSMSPGEVTCLLPKKKKRWSFI
jgi:hypothetical protein